jgi:hypothetical protein
MSPRSLTPEVNQIMTTSRMISTKMGIEKPNLFLENSIFLRQVNEKK